MRLSSYNKGFSTYKRSHKRSTRLELRQRKLKDRRLKCIRLKVYRIDYISFKAGNINDINKSLKLHLLLFKL